METSVVDGMSEDRVVLLFYEEAIVFAVRAASGERQVMIAAVSREGHTAGVR